MRKGISVFLQLFQEHGKAILIAPTGYGKTLASLEILRRMKEKGVSAGLIHTVPLKSLVEKIYLEKFEGKGFKTGYQSQGRLPGAEKSPFFLRELVVTTLDSFVMNLYKAPVAEFNKVMGDVSPGHYYVPLTSILTSTVVFDEAHMYLGDVDESISLPMIHAAINALVRLKTPVAVETATMNTNVVGEVAGKMAGEGRVPLVYVSCAGNRQLEKLRSNPRVELHEVCDEEYEKANSIEWVTRIVEADEMGKVVDEALKTVDEGGVALVVRNTVEKAVETFHGLERRLGGRYRLLLIHGRLSTADRERAVQRMNDIMSEGGIIVSTQVIEAGVETNASILITDAAPVENLAQRAGRLCREGSRIFEKCRENGAQVYVIKPKSGFKDRVDVYSAERVVKTLEGLKQFLEAGKAVDWRLLGTDGEEGRVSFTEILESAVPPPAATTFKEKTYEEMLESYLESDTSFEVFKKIRDLLGEEGFFRKTVQVRLAVPLNGGYDYVDVDFEWLMRKERELVKNNLKPCLEYYPDGRARVLGFDHVNEKWVEKPSEKISLEWLRGEGFPGKHFLNYPGDLYRVAREDREEVTRYFALLLRKECYEPGIGLVIKRE